MKAIRNAFKAIVSQQLKLRKYTFIPELSEEQKDEITKIMKKVSEKIAILNGVSENDELTEAFPVFEQFFTEVFEEWPFLSSRLTSSQIELFKFVIKKPRPACPTI